MNHDAMANFVWFAIATSSGSQNHNCLDLDESIPIPIGQVRCYCVNWRDGASLYDSLVFDRDNEKIPKELVFFLVVVVFFLPIWRKQTSISGGYWMILMDFPAVLVRFCLERRCGQKWRENRSKSQGDGRGVQRCIMVYPRIDSWITSVYASL